MTVHSRKKKYRRLIKERFKLISPIYNLVTFPLGKLRRKVVKFAELEKNAKILDIGTGTGRQAFAFAKEGYKVIGIDISEEMLKKAKLNNRFPNVSFQITDATKMPFENNHFDGVCASFTLHEMPRQIINQVLDEMVRVTKPQGTVLIIDFAAVKESFSKRLMYHFLSMVEGHMYSQFVQLDLLSFLKHRGIVVEKKWSILWGMGNMLKGRVDRH